MLNCEKNKNSNTADEMIRTDAENVSAIGDFFSILLV